MTTFKDLHEASGDLVPSIMMPDCLRELKTLARQMTSSFHQEVPMIFGKMETKMNWWGYTFGPLDNSDLPESGKETFFVLGVADKKVVKNVYVVFEWEKLASGGITGPAMDMRPDGSALKYSVKVAVQECSPDELEAMLDANLFDVEDGESFYRPDEDMSDEENNQEQPDAYTEVDFPDFFGNYDPDDLDESFASAKRDHDASKKNESKLDEGDDTVGNPKVDIFHKGKYLWSTNKHKTVRDAVAASKEHLSDKKHLNKLMSDDSVYTSLAREHIKGGIALDTVKGKIDHSNR
jgi:hypothetical protein